MWRLVHSFINIKHCISVYEHDKQKTIVFYLYTSDHFKTQKSKKDILQFTVKAAQKKI